MPDAAHYAEMSWPDRNYHFRRGWAEPPPPMKRSWEAAPTTSAAIFVSTITATADTLSSKLIQRAKAWDRAADAELALGHHAAAERLSRLAENAREAAI